jgi:DNA-binding MarR family transcriptional regulator
LNNFSEKILRLRNWEREFFPKNASCLFYDVIFAIASHRYMQKDLSVKDLCTLIPHSPRAIKYAADHLVEDGWCYWQNSQADRRVRYLISTDKLFELISQYEAEFAAVLLKREM